METTPASILTFIPARDFELASAFYEAIGFECPSHDEGVRYFGMGDVGFLLQDFWVEAWAENFMMAMHVEDTAAIIARVDAVREQFEGVRTQAPQMEDWGMIVGYFWDPTGVLWHITQRPESA